MLLVCGGCQGGLGALRLTRVLGPGPIRQAQGRLDAGMAEGVRGRCRGKIVDRIQGRHWGPSAGAVSATRGEAR